ncbi:MAG: PrpR N-terminal domain-containing protein [Pseudomonadota bacterium]
MDAEPKNAVPVALIAPYAGMADLAGEIREEFEKPILIEVGDLLEGVRKGKELVDRGVEVLISRGGTAQLLKKHMQIPIAEIKVTAYDILQALQKVGSRGQRIGIIGFGNVIYGAGALGTLLNLDLAVFAIQKREEVALRLDEAKKARVDIIIGDKVVISQANERGYPSILIESGKEAILQSFHEAYQILEVVRSEARKSREYLETLQRLRAVMDSEKRYHELSIVDDLTQLYNSRHFYFQLKIELDRSNRYEQPLTLLLFDLDNFKAFNDAYGHVEGDQVLWRLGQVVKRCLRETDFAYRYGGEEFTILLPMTTSADGAVTAERIRTEFKKETFSPAPGQDVHVTVSIGLAQYKPQEDMKAFVRRVDQLMYQGKKNGKDRICSES